MIARLVTSLLAIGLAIGLAIAPAVAAPIAIVGAKVHVAPGTTLEGATVVIDRGRITAVGVGVAVPTGATVIDGTGKVVTAGLIEPLSSVGLVGIDLEAASVDGRFGDLDAVHADAIHAAYQAQDGFDPAAVTVPVARSGGVTTVVAAPAGGLVSGRSAVYALDGSPAPIVATAAVHGALGHDGAGAVGGSRGRALGLLRELLDDASAFAASRAAFDRNQSREMIADRLDLAALAPVLRRTVPLVLAIDRAADIRAALRLATAQKVRLVIVGGAEAWQVAAELAAAKVPVILDPSANLPSHLDATDVRDDAPAVLAAAGVAVAVSTLGGNTSARTVRQLAGVAVGNGLPWDRALAAVTTVPAAIYGLRDRGTVARGQVADVVVWSGDPLELATAAEVVIIGGAVQSAVSHQTRLLDRYRRLPVP